MKGFCGPGMMPRGILMRMMENCCEGEEGCEGHGHMGHGHGHGFERRFRTREEQIADLEEYLKDLETEVAAVKEAIADLKP
jgi:hypothetical protein